MYTSCSPRAVQLLPYVLLHSTMTTAQRRSSNQADAVRDLRPLSLCTVQAYNRKSALHLHLLYADFTHVVDQPEDVVEDKVASLSIRQQLECLRVVHRSLLLIHQECTRYLHEDGAFTTRRLCVECRDLVLNLAKWKALLL